MDLKKLLLASVASFLFMFLAGFVFYALLMHEWYLAHTGTAGDIGRAVPLFPYLAGGVFMSALILSYLYPHGYKSGESKAIQGLKFGIPVGLLVSLAMGLIRYGTTEELSLSALVMDTIFHVVEYGIAGVIIAVIYGDVGGE